ncbi:MAG TPA: hypothetical protein HPQ03_01890 [Deltaproteobacteria bacterium]|nr:hypothetical protein [Deltaproteobacteria bacterium]
MAKLKITDSEVIKSGERELLDIIIGDLDWEAIEKIVKEKHQLRIQDDVEFKQGDIVVHGNTVAYKLDFDVKVTLTVLLDRDGNYLSFSTSGDFTSDATGADLEEEPEPGMEASETDEVNAAQGDETILEEISQPEDSPDPEEKQDSAPPPSYDPEKSPDENMSGMASQIAEMLSEINAENEE